MAGYMGKLLVVNLTNGEINDEPLNEDWCRDFIGGSGYACRYLIDKISRDTDPLGPENVLMIMTGPLTATSAPTSGRWVVCSKSPLSGIWGESHCGGEFGWQLKSTGYDGIVITGAASAPTYLSIIHGEASLQDASELWGLGAYSVTEQLKEKSGDKLAKVACIGPAGENLVKFATVTSEERVAGRLGMGAVMGSKKLKAIVVRGNQKVEFPDAEAFKEAAKEANQLVMEPFTTNMMKELGTSGGVDMYNLSGELPVKCYRKSGFDGAFNISGATMKETILVKNRHCWGCPIGCGRVVEVKEEGPWQTPVTEGPEYETIAGFGSMLLIDNLKAISKLNMTCNDLGIDTISSSTTISFLMDIFEQGKISVDDCDGIEPKWGDPALVQQLLEKIAAREGIGDILADGSDAVGRKFGIEQDQIPTVDGVEVTYHDLRSCFGMAIAYGIGPYGPSHNALDAYNILLGQPFPEIGVNVVDKFEVNETLAETMMLSHDFRAFTNSLIVCSFCV
nr:aldehyde ferredoxin oxidoreductase family protein [Candidatus Lokiarchaeia archaeon]